MKNPFENAPESSKSEETTREEILKVPESARPGSVDSVREALQHTRFINRESVKKDRAEGKPIDARREDLIKKLDMEGSILSGYMLNSEIYRKIREDAEKKGELLDGDELLKRKDNFSVLEVVDILDRVLIDPLYERLSDKKAIPDSEHSNEWWGEHIDYSIVELIKIVQDLQSRLVNEGGKSSSTSPYDSGGSAEKSEVSHSSQPEKFEGGEAKEIPIPENWDVLTHGTNLERPEWRGDKVKQLDDDILVVKGTGLSVVGMDERKSNKEKAEALRKQGISSGNFDTTENYAKGEGGVVSINVIFPGFNSRKSGFGEQKEALEKKYGVDKANEITSLTDSVYWRNIQSGRHPVLPNGTRLIKLYDKQVGDKRELTYIPESLLEVYQAETRLPHQEESGGDMIGSEKVSEYSGQISAEDFQLMRQRAETIRQKEQASQEKIEEIRQQLGVKLEKEEIKKSQPSTEEEKKYPENIAIFETPQFRQIFLEGEGQKSTPEWRACLAYNALKNVFSDPNQLSERIKQIAEQLEREKIIAEKRKQIGRAHV